jgi:hypothetical protein
MNRDLDEFVRCELSQLSAGGHALDEDVPLPRRLFYPCDAPELDAVMRSRTIPAIDWRLGWDGPLVQYGVELVRSHLEGASGEADNGLRTRFRDDVRTYFDPRGTHFDGFVTRLFDIGSGSPQDGFPGYALGMAGDALAARDRTAASHGTVRLASAIYSSERQHAIVQALYRRYEDYLITAVERFGESCADDVSSSCTDRFRRDIGCYIMRFRDPGLSGEREWIALALAAADGRGQPLWFDIRANRLVPAVALDIAAHGLPRRRRSLIDVIAVGPSLPAASTRESLEAYLRWQGLPGVAVVGFNDLP